MAPKPIMVLPFFPTWLAAGLVVLLTMAIYWPALRCGLVNYDDDVYVTSNTPVQNGLTPENSKWAFLTPVSGNWHPLTMLSLMLD